MKDSKNDMNHIGIRHDRPMTTLEIEQAAMNYNAVKQSAETHTDLGCIGWSLIGLGFLMVIIAILFF